MTITIPAATLMNEKEAAAYLGLSVDCLQARRSMGRAPRYIKLGRAVRYDRADLEAFVESCRVTPYAEAE